MCYFFLRRSTQVGRRGAPAKGVGRETGARASNTTVAGGRRREREMVQWSADSKAVKPKIDAGNHKPDQIPPSPPNGWTTIL